MPSSIARTYPHRTEWITTHGWIELGQTDEHYPSMEDALQAAEQAVITCWR
jgi:hypothetical protein